MCGEKATTTLFYFFTEPRTAPPAAGRPSPSVPCRGRRLTHLCKHMFKFAKSLATRRRFPRAFLWPERCFGHRQRPLMSCAAVADASAATLVLAGAGRRWIGHGPPLDRARMAQIQLARGSNRSYIGQPGIKLKEHPQLL
jgi:hypothetical protein